MRRTPPPPAAPVPPTDADADPVDPDDPAGTDAPSAADAAPPVDLSGLPVAGLTRRRLGFLVASFVCAWIVIVFARQTGEAAAASARVEQAQAANTVLAADVDALERELRLIQRQEYIVQQARGYRLGHSGEQPFTLAANAAPLPADAPGSAALRLGAEAPVVSPLESWLSLLFGPGR